MSDQGSDSRTWLFGPGTDLVLGCGIGSIAMLALQAGVGQRALAAWVPGALLILVFSLPHYGATLVRVYEDPADRRKYRVFATGATALLVAAFVGSLYGHAFGSLLLTVYLTWSPWHYSGQNYGIALMLAGRRGDPIGARTKRFVYASFVTSYLLTFFAIHSAQPTESYAPVAYAGTVYELLAIGLPHDWVGVAIAAVGAVYLVTSALAVRGLVVAGGLRGAMPSLVLMLTQALWFVLPVPVRHWGLAGADSIFHSVYTAYGFLWIAGYHALQYLWITTYYATESGAEAGQRAGAWRRRAVFLGKAALMGYAVWTVPALLFAPGLLGALPYDAGLALMVAAVVNLHHFILDGAVWKLRDGRVARILLAQRPTPDADPRPLEEAAPPRTPWLRRGLQVIGAACVLYGGFTFWGGDFGFGKALSRGDVTTARSAIERLTWLGRDSAAMRTELGRRLAREGDRRGARQELERSLALNPTSRGYQSLGLLHEQAGEWGLAATAYDSALAIGEEDATTLFRAGRAWLESGDAGRAVPLLERAEALAPDQKLVSLQLARARREAKQESERAIP